MANTKRRKGYTDRNGNMFVPMNVEGGVWNEHFISTPKFVLIVSMIAGLIGIIYYLAAGHFGIIFSILLVVGYLFICLQLTRFVIFEEKFYYHMYKEMQEHEITTPSIFWDIASIKDTEDGAIMTYSDAKIGIIVKIERDTITGKTADFREIHYDAISDFYRELMTNRYSFVQLNVMEQAGKDPRLNELNKLVHKSTNPNINKLMEIEVGHIKNITHRSLYETDYFVFYTHDISKMDSIFGDITECIIKLLDGAYTGYHVLDSKEIVDLVKDQYGVNYFNATEASLLMFNNSAALKVPPFSIYGIIWKDGMEQKLKDVEKIRLQNLASSVLKEDKKQEGVSFKKTLYRKESENRIGIDFDELSTASIQQSKPSYNKYKDTARKMDKNGVSLDNENAKKPVDNKPEHIGGMKDNNDDEYIDF